MPSFHQTVKSGASFESDVKALIAQYSDSVFSNVRIQTPYTVQSETEVDILALFGFVFLVVEVKNIRAIEGHITDPVWQLKGYQTGTEYTALNIFTQNRLHVRSFKNAWFDNFNEFPKTIACVVVPDECEFDDSLKPGQIYTISQFAAELVNLAKLPKDRQSHYRLNFLVSSDNKITRKGG